MTPLSRSGRFSKSPDAHVRRYTESISFDKRLYRQDIAGSIAHATMLARSGILKQREASSIVRGLRRLEKEISSGKFLWRQDLEDVHMNIEAALTARVPAAAKLHTARSRNDQVATDLRLWVKEEIRNLVLNIRDLQRALWKLASRNPHLALPGYTHLQRAQPVLAAHHLLAYVEMLERDHSRFADVSRRADVCPLGSGAIAGTSLPIRRSLTTRLLGFSVTSANSMDAVSDRDFVAEFLFAAALTGIHLSRLAEDLILWSGSEFHFITLADSHTTGSSLMPHKKNPDVAELGRGKAGRLIGNLVSLLTLLKGLPMTYNRDLQEDKEPLFDSADTLKATLQVFAGMIQGARFHVATCQTAVSDSSLLATEIADWLVRQGIPFRKAHHLVGEAVRFAESRSKSLTSLTSAEWRKLHPALGSGVSSALKLETFFKQRNRLQGSPSPHQVALQLQKWKKRLDLKGTKSKI